MNCSDLKSEIDRIAWLIIDLPPDKAAEVLRVEISKLPADAREVILAYSTTKAITMKSSPPIQSPPLWQMIAIFAFGVIFVSILLGLAFLVPNPTPFQYQVSRIILAIAAAAIATLLTGFIDVEIPRLVKAGGALAVFVIVYFYNPASLVVHSTEASGSAIPPLQSPAHLQSVSGLPSNRSTSLFPCRLSAMTVALDFDSPDDPDLATRYSVGNNNSLIVREILGEGPFFGSKVNNLTHFYDVIISNNSDQQLLLTDFEFEWRYAKGIAESTEMGTTLMPTEKYSIVFPINVEDESWRRQTQAIYPPIVLPPKNKSGPSIFSFRLQISWQFEKESLQYHPAVGWDILYSVGIRGEKDSHAVLFDTWSWQQEKSAKHKSQFEKPSNDVPKQSLRDLLRNQ